jgi:hypothetical protein
MRRRGSRGGVRAVLAGIAVRIPGSERLVRPAPRIRIGPERTVPGALVRLVPGTCLLVCAGLLGREPGIWLATLLAAALTTWRPAGPTSAVFAAGTGVTVLAGSDLLAAGSPGAAPARLAALVLAVHLALQATALCVHVSGRSRVQVSVLLGTVRSVLPVQAVTQVLVLITLGVRTHAAPGQGWVRAAAVVGAVTVALLVLPRRQPDGSAPGPG